jgi:hypothetical protein
MSRLAIRKDILRNLSIRSKNKCAFPGCDHPILTPRGEYIAELCHIEAAEPGGPRYNPLRSDEDRRSYENLLFLCHRHHKETDDELRYSVTRLKEMKQAHETLPEVVFNHEVLMRAVETVLAEQAKLSNLLQHRLAEGGSLADYPIRTSWIQDAWTPERGRFFESHASDGAGFKFMMRDGWLHVEQALKDGAVAYYEVNEEGDVRHSRLPYPINEYRVVIPPTLILAREAVSSQIGERAIRTLLKWSAGTIVEHFVSESLVGVDCHARCIVSHSERTIVVVEPRNM